MVERSFVPLVMLLLSTAGLSGCATSATPGPATLTFEQHSLRIPFTVDADGSVSLAEHPPLVGRLDLSSILKAEGVRPGTASGLSVQMMLHYGRLYVASNAFHSVWEITPHPGTTSASYRPVLLLRAADVAPVKDLRLSRYGSAHASCLRVDRAGSPPVFINSSGEAQDACP